MKRNLLNIACCASLVLAFVACTKVPDVQENEIKSPIELSTGGVDVSSVQTKAITLDPNDVSKLSTLATGTSLYMVFKSEYVGSGSPQTAKYSMTKGVTKAANGSTKVSEIDFSADGCTRYWDDAFARDAALSVYAVCTPDGTPVAPTIGGNNTYPYTSMPTTGAWTTTANPLTIANWGVIADQGALNAKTFADQDLCYSNNLSEYDNGSPVDARLKFDAGTKKFMSGQMNFYHALSRITINIVMGAGFQSTETDFQFSDNTNIALKNVNVSNTVFDIASGEFTGDYTNGNVTRMFLSGSTSNTYQLDAYVLPGTDLSSTTAADVSFTINDNLYELTKKQLLDVISDSDKTAHLSESKYLKPGVKYIFTITVGKTKIDKITATLVDWEAVDAINLPADNARIVVNSRSTGTAVTSGIDLYRSLNQSSTIDDGYESFSWRTSYDKATSFAYDEGSHLWSSPWFWESNKHFYHLRTISPSGHAVSSSSDDYFALESAEPTYTDVEWGAPFTNISQISYTTSNGFDGSGNPHQIYKAIGPTNSTINMTMFHMMSDVTFKVQTSGGIDAVVLEDNGTKTSIKLEDINKSGKALMGNGLVSTTSGNADWSFTQTPTEETGVWKWTCGVVPQSLSDVVLVITTPDHNQYKVALGDVYVASSSISSNNISNPYSLGTGDNAAKYNVNYWYPGFRYSYTFTLRKKAIDKITATVLGWEDVVAADDNVQIQ